MVKAEDSDIRAMEEALEQIGQGMETAIEERIKSERMKVELVANVSHDIKTPLTSIISYIELLKQEENLSPEIQDYIRILEEKSERLKNMVQDVFLSAKRHPDSLRLRWKKLILESFCGRHLQIWTVRFKRACTNSKLIYLRRRSWYMPTETGCTGYSRI